MRILIVDDVKGWRDYHSQVVKMFIGPDCEIYTADSARMGYDILLQNNNAPFDIIFTDLQMEQDFEPKYAGEWFVEQIKSFKNCYKTKVVIISAAYNIQIIADSLGVYFIRKSTARSFPDVYKSVLLCEK